ncbi:MAG: ion transporter [Eubacterium sp.]|nr:ion transporter [Eubacterium sp.]
MNNPIQKKETRRRFHQIRRRIFDIIQISNTSDLPSTVFDIALVCVIITNILMMFLETFGELARWHSLFNLIEALTLVFFCVEYALRIWTADFLYPSLSKRSAILHFIVSFDGVIDLLTILPFFFLTGFIAFRMLRIVRIFHLFRINTNYDSFNVITSVIYDKKNQLISSLFIIFMLMMASSLGMYSVEHAAQPGVFRNAFSGLWWSVSTVLTVGYGDIYPVTTVGKVLAIIISFLGVGAVALPTGIISAGFVESYTKAQNSDPTPDIHLQTVTVDIDSRWIGLTASEIQGKYDTIVLVANRGKTTLRPNASYRVDLGDVLAVYRIPDDGETPGGKAKEGK